MAVRIITRSGGKSMISGAEISASNLNVGSGAEISTRTSDGTLIARQDATGEVNFDLNGVAYRRNGVAPDGSRAGDWKAKPNENVDDAI